MDIRSDHGRRTAVRVALAVAAVLLATATVLGVGLPDQALADHWSLAWSGLDVATAAAALGTAVLLVRQDRRAALTASAGAALLVLDAWFDVTTATGTAATWLAGTEAALLELPLALLAVRVAIVLLREPSSPLGPATHPSMVTVDGP